MVPVVRKAVGYDLVNKWIQRNRSLGKTNDEMNGTIVVFGDGIYTISKTDSGELDVQLTRGNVVIFRDMKELAAENECRACGMLHDTYKEAVECCMNMDE